MKINIKKLSFLFLGILSLVSIVYIFAHTKTGNEAKIISTDPANKEQDVLENKQIIITFDTKINDSFKKNISFSSVPSFKYEETWINNIYKISPKEDLTNNTLYTININYSGKSIYTFSFTTAIFSRSQIQDTNTVQAQNDLVFGKALTNLSEKYPFYSKLPIKTQDYVVYYDFDKNKFAITFLDNSLSVTNKNKLTQDALQKIKDIGAEEPIEYYTKP